MAQSLKLLRALQRKNANDVVVTMAIRSPLCKAKKGGFRDMRFVVFSCLMRVNANITATASSRSDELLTEMFRVCITWCIIHCL
jgi:hypothetical protein